MKINLFIAILIILLSTSCASEKEKLLMTTSYNAQPVSLKKITKGKWKRFRAKNIIEDGKYADYDKIHPEYLTYDLYKPAGRENDVLPLVIFLHSGAFITGDKKNYIITQYCKDLARTGEFATASVNYRLINFDEIDDITNILAGISKPYTRSRLMQSLGDVNAAINYFIQNADKLKIDNNRIFLVGFSAGGFLANQVVFTDLKEAYDYINESIEKSLIEKLKDNLINSIDSTYNKIDNQYIFKKNIKDNIAGVISLSGGILDDKMIDDDDNMFTPMLLIHGNNDKMVPLGKDHPFQIYAEKDVEIDYLNFYFNLGVKKSIDTQTEKNITKTNTHITFSTGPIIPKSAIKKFLNSFTSQVCGSKCLYEKTFPDSDMKLIVVEGAPHVYMLNTDGLFNKTYLQTRKYIYDFLIDKSKLRKIKNRVRL